MHTCTHISTHQQMQARTHLHTYMHSYAFMSSFKQAHTKNSHTYANSVTFAHMLLRAHSIYVRAFILCTSHTHIQMHSYVCTYALARIYICTYACSCMLIHAFNMHPFMPNLHTPHACTHTCTLTLTHTHVHSHSHIHIFTNLFFAPWMYIYKKCENKIIWTQTHEHKHMHTHTLANSITLSNTSPLHMHMQYTFKHMGFTLHSSPNHRRVHTQMHNFVCKYSHTYAYLFRFCS